MSIATQATRLVAISLCTMLAGCAGCVPDPPPAPVPVPSGSGYGVPCTSSLPKGTDPVHVVIRFVPSPGGSPEAHPEGCTVRKGTVVYLVTEPGVATPFDIQFKQAGSSLFAIDQRARDPAVSGIWQGSMPQGGRQVLQLDASAVDGTYSYNMRANGLPPVDPVIIIRQR